MSREIFDHSASTVAFIASHPFYSLRGTDKKSGKRGNAVDLWLGYFIVSCTSGKEHNSTDKLKSFCMGAAIVASQLKAWLRH